jgi:hypothetical protein
MNTLRYLFSSIILLTTQLSLAQQVTTLEEQSLVTNQFVEEREFKLY